MAQVEIKLKGIKEFQAALRRNPNVIKQQGGNLVTSVKNIIVKKMHRSPWKVGQSGTGKGIPKDTGRLRDAHIENRINKLNWKIWTDTGKADYAVYVHGGTGKMKKRPWFDIIEKETNKEMDRYIKNFFTKVLHNLTK